MLTHSGLRFDGAITLPLLAALSYFETIYDLMSETDKRKFLCVCIPPPSSFQQHLYPLSFQTLWFVAVLLFRHCSFILQYVWVFESLIKLESGRLARRVNMFACLSKLGSGRWARHISVFELVGVSRWARRVSVFVCFGLDRWARCVSLFACLSSLRSGRWARCQDNIFHPLWF